MAGTWTALTCPAELELQKVSGASRNKSELFAEDCGEIWKKFTDRGSLMVSGW